MLMDGGKPEAGCQTDLPRGPLSPLGIGPARTVA